jgi:hypothetical protein
LITFSFALLLFVAVLTVVYLVLLLFDDRFKGGFKRCLKVRTTKIALIGACASMVLLIVFQRFWNTSVFYFLLYPVTVFLLLIAVVKSSDSNRTFLVISVLLLHLIALSLVVLPSGIMLTERTPALVKLDVAKTWNPEWQMINPYYNPFPMDLGFSYAFSEITGISYADWFGIWIIFLLFVITYDLTLFSLVKGVSGSWKIGVLSILLFTFTPPLVINPQPQWLASLFILVFMLGVFKALKYSPSISSIILVNLSYAIAILLHGTAAIGVVVVSVLLILMFLGRKFGVNIATTAHHRSFVYVVSISVYVMTLGRWVVLGGIDPVISPLMGLVNDILGYGEVSFAGAQYVPLYDQFVSPISAYAWSVPISLAIAFLLYHFVNRVQKKSLNVVFLSSLCVAAAGLTFSGFVGSVFVASENLQRYLGYAGMALFIPVAAVVGIKIIQSLSWKVVGIGLVSIVLFSGIGVCDPALSPQLYREIKSVSPTGSADLIEGNTLYGILSERTSIVSTYEILTALWYLQIIPESSGKPIRFYASSLKTHRIMMENLTREKEAVLGVTYIWTPEILELVNDTLVNVVYNSGRHVAVGRGG